MSTEARRLTENEAADYLGHTVRTLQDWRNRGVGPAYLKSGRSVRYDTRDLDTYLASIRVEPKAA